MTYTSAEVSLGADEYWVLGDNRNQSSEDSHVNGPVKRKQVLAELWTLD